MTVRPIILLDIMDTLVVEPFYTALPAFFGMTLDQLCAVKHPTSWVEFEEGRISEEEYVRRFFADQRPVDAAALRRCLWNAYQWVDGMQEVVAGLHAAGYEIHALSNYSQWYELIEEKLELSRYLAWTFVSCRTGVRKPDRQAFLGAADQLKVPAGECLFIDDRSANTSAARALGMDAVLKQDADQVRDELVRRRLLAP